MDNRRWTVFFGECSCGRWETAVVGPEVAEGESVEVIPRTELLDAIGRLGTDAFEAHEESKRLRDALTEIAENRHGYQRPAGLIASRALEGRPLPNRDGSCPHEWGEWKDYAEGRMRHCALCLVLDRLPGTRV